MITFLEFLALQNSKGIKDASGILNSRNLYSLLALSKVYDKQLYLFPFFFTCFEQGCDNQLGDIPLYHYLCHIIITLLDFLA